MLSEPQPVDCPSERGRNYTPVEPVRCVLPEAPCREQMISADFQSVPIITGEATLPLRWLPLCGLAAREHLALQAVPVQQVYNSSIPNSGRLWYNKVNDKLEFCEGEVSMKKIGLGIAILLFAIIISLCSSGMGLLVIGIGIVGLIFSIIGFIENK